MISMINVYDVRGITNLPAIRFLFDLLAERTPEQSISHQKMPSFEAHEKFVRSCPYREWLLIEAPVPQGLVGAVYITRLNEIGIAIKESARRQGYGSQAIRYIQNHYKPLPGAGGLRSDRFIAHVAPGNDPSRKLFEGLGGKLIQVTYQL